MVQDRELTSPFSPIKWGVVLMGVVMCAACFVAGYQTALNRHNVPELEQYRQEAAENQARINQAREATRRVQESQDRSEKAIQRALQELGNASEEIGRALSGLESSDSIPRTGATTTEATSSPKPSGAKSDAPRSGSGRK